MTQELKKFNFFNDERKEESIIGSFIICFKDFQKLNNLY